MGIPCANPLTIRERELNVIMENPPSLKNEGPQKELDPLDVSAMMAFIKDFPGILPDQDRRRLLSWYEHDPSKREGIVKRSKGIVEDALKKEFERILPPRSDWSYHFIFAPYSMSTGEQLQVPGVLVHARSDEGKDSRWGMFLASKSALDQFKAIAKKDPSGFAPVLNGRSPLP